MEPSYLVEEASALFRATYGSEPQVVAVAPGRVNLIGEHTDYNLGFVFPMAIHRGIAVAARIAEEPSTYVSAQAGRSEFEPKSKSEASKGDWGIYPNGVAWAIAQMGLGVPPSIEAAVFGDLPIGIGVSSSAALEVGFAAIWGQLMGLELDPEQLARIGQLAENEFVGLQCGIMDQLASAAAREGTAMFIDVRSLEIRHARIPDEFKVVLCDTGVKHELVASKYNDRRTECQQAAKELGVLSLRDATLDDLSAKQATMDTIAFRRARHVITENARCQSFYWALEDRNELRIGLLMRASHESLREDFEVTVSETDAMAEACWSAPGCIGARMTGGGFGGACVAIVHASQLESFRRSAASRYESITDRKGTFSICEPAEGVRLWTPS